MALETRAPLDAGLLSSLSGTFFKRLADGRWACFFLFGGKEGRILPSQTAGRLIGRVSVASALLAWVTSVAAMVLARGAAATGNPTTDVLLMVAAGFAGYLTVVLPSGLWLRRRYGDLPVTNETLLREERGYQSRIFAWIGFTGAALMFFMAGGSYVENHREAARDSLEILAIATVLAGISGFRLNSTIRAAHR